MSRRRKITRAGGVCLALCGALLLVRGVAPPIAAGIGSSHAVFDRQERLLRLSLTADDKYRLRLELEAMAPALVDATLLHEDRGFYRHPGVNPVALGRAFYLTYVSGGRRVGGSTITMQLARILWRLDSRTLGGKLVQVARALELELLYSKRDILTAYLNLAPYGGNIEGAGAASLIYFGKEASRLSVAEALTLAVIPQSPSRRAPASSQTLAGARRRLFTRYLAFHPDCELEVQALAVATHKPGELPFLAPHFVDAAIRRAPERPTLFTTLDLELQQSLERHVRAYVARQRAFGIDNAAALLVDWRDMSIVAEVGSAAFFDAAIQGQVSGTTAKRSPGSALKPFIYALAIDQGLIHPLSVLKDTAKSFGGYDPENFDSDFAGPLYARDALIKSRNVPAVALATKLASPSLYGLLRQAGIAGLKDEAHYGLSLVLGSAEVTMRELAGLYAMLANGGELRPLVVEPGSALPVGVRLLSPEAAFAALDMLRSNPRPQQVFASDWTRDRLAVAWKTGTSHGFRDAWSVGVFGPYVLAVWLGRFDGQGRPAFVGARAAAPLFFEIVDSVRAERAEVARVSPPRPRGLARVEVCADSGDLAGPHCRRKVQTWFLPGKSPIRVCQVHREVLVDVRSGLRACAPSAFTRPEVFEFWPSDLLALFAKAGVPRRLPPQDAPGCSIVARATHGMPPEITSPEEGVDYSLRSRAVGEDTVPLTAVTDADVRSVFWFVDEALVGSATRGEPLFWTPKPGSFTVRVVDDQGRSDAKSVKVVVVR